MRGKLVAVAVVLVLLVGGGAAFVTGFGPAPGGADASGTDIEDFPTQTPTASGGSSGGSTASGSTASGTTASGTTTGTATADRPEFRFTIDRIEECGNTCRDVTSTLRNNGSAPATDVVVYTRVFVGNGTDGDVIWEGKEEVGRLDPNATHTATRRVELSYREGIAVQNADGWITIQTTVVSNERTVTFTQQRDVA